MGKTRNRKRVAAAVLAGALFALVLAGASLADHNPSYAGTAETHFVVDGNPTCPAGTTAGGSIKVDPGSNGTFGGLVTISGYDGQSFDWSFTQLGANTRDMAAVIVKGGPNAVVYSYDHLGAGVDDSDSGLTAPLNPNGNQPNETKFYGISHIEFCFDLKEGEETGKLIVEKVVENSNATPDDFTFEVDGIVRPFEADGSNEVELVAGTYTVTEPEANQNGYTTTYENCDDIDVGPDGDTPVCTITNTLSEEPTGNLIVKKVVVGSQAPASSFAFSVNGGETVPFEADGDNELVGLPEGDYTVTEPDYEGYTTTYENCSEVKVGPQVDGTPTCTITNTADEQPPTPGGLIVIKRVIGTDDSPSQFSFQIDDGEPTSFDADGQNDLTLPDGTYDVTEPQANQNGYTTTYDNCNDVQVSSNQEQTPVCTITNSTSSTPPPPPFVPPPTPKLDVWVQKGATPQVTLQNGTGAITYDVVVSNNGPNQANNVTLNDSAPAGVTFGSVTSGPSKGTCSITPTTLSCNFGVVGPGVVVTLSFSATVTATGTYSNTVCVASDGKADTNLANNCSTASTVVVAPITPPTVTPPVAKPPVAKPPVVKKPKPRKPQNICAVLTISTRTVPAGKFTGVAVKVTRSGKAVAGAKVRFKGPGIFKAVTTKKTGMAVTKLRPSKTGIVRINVVNKKACSAKRIGVLGTFEPPLTG